MKRVCQAKLLEYLGDFPCVAVLGPRQCGKTTLLGTLDDRWRVFDLERQSDYDAISRDPDLFLRLNPSHVAIDEAQLLPELFSALRVAIDADRQTAGRFVITGSSSPLLLKSISESLAGRVAMIELAPFSFAETRQELGSAFFDALAGSELPDPGEWARSLKPRFGLRDIHAYWLKGGYPEPWLKTRPQFRRTWCENYVRTYLERDIGRLFPGLAYDRFRRFVRMLGELSGTILNYADIARALAVSQPTVRDYMYIAHGTFVWRRLPAFVGSPLKRAVRHPKGYLRDSGLLHHLLRVHDIDTLLGHPAMGRSWEGMVIEEILRGLNGRGVSCEAYHYRTAAGAEIDLVLEGDFGLVPIEIKYRQTIEGRDIQAAKRFVDEHGCRAGIVINNDERARLYDERIIGIPFACL